MVGPRKYPQGGADDWTSQGVPVPNDREARDKWGLNEVQTGMRFTEKESKVRKKKGVPNGLLNVADHTRKIGRKLKEI